MSIPFPRAVMLSCTWTACKATAWCQTGYEWSASAVALGPTQRCRLPSCDPTGPFDPARPRCARCWKYQTGFLSWVLWPGFLRSLNHSSRNETKSFWVFFSQEHFTAIIISLLPLPGFVFFPLFFVDEVLDKMQYSGEILTTAREAKREIMTITSKHFCRLKSA